MVNYFEASRLVINDPSKERIIDAYDYGEFWLFSVGPIDYDEKSTYQSGTIFPIVFKDDGKISLYDITTNPIKFRNAKRMN